MIDAVMIGNGMVEAHRAGCRDIARKYGPRYEPYRYANLDVLYSELLDTGDPNEPGYFEDEIKVYPCTR